MQSLSSEEKALLKEEAHNHNVSNEIVKDFINYSRLIVAEGATTVDPKILWRMFKTSPVGLLHKF